MEQTEGTIITGKRPIKSVGICKLIRSVRFMVAMLILFAVLCQYAAKIDLSVNIVCMLNHTAYIGSSSDTTNPDCPAMSGNHSDGRFAWNSAQKANALAAFFYGYLISEVPGGMLAKRYGSKLVIGSAVALNAICAWHYSTAVQTQYGLFVFLRVLVGFGCGLMLPAISHIWTVWAPVAERSFLIGVALSGAHLAPIIMLPLGGVMCSDPLSDWKNMFYVVASLETLWIILWFALFSNYPQDSKFISEEEISYINQTNDLQPISALDKGVPWKAIFESRACWALFACHTFYNWGLYTLLTEIPSYMKQVLNFDIKDNGLYSALPYMVIWMTTALSSYIADLFLAKNILSRTKIRKVAVAMGTFLPAIFLIALGFMKCNQRSEAVALLAIGQGLFGISWGSGHMCNANDLAPVHAGVLFGISNTFATIPGILTPYVTAAITSDHLQSQWQIVFAVSAVFLCLGGIIFIIFGDASAQQWDSNFEIPAHHRSMSSIQ